MAPIDEARPNLSGIKVFRTSKSGATADAKGKLPEYRILGGAQESGSKTSGIDTTSTVLRGDVHGYGSHFVCGSQYKGDDLAEAKNKSAESAGCHSSAPQRAESKNLNWYEARRNDKGTLHPRHIRS